MENYKKMSCVNIEMIWANEIFTRTLKLDRKEDSSDDEIIQMLYFSTNADHLLDPDRSIRGLGEGDQIKIDGRHYILRCKEGVLAESC